MLSGEVVEEFLREIQPRRRREVQQARLDLRNWRRFALILDPMRFLVSLHNGGKKEGYRIPLGHSVDKRTGSSSRIRLTKRRDLE